MAPAARPPPPLPPSPSPSPRTVYAALRRRLGSRRHRRRPQAACCSALPPPPKQERRSGRTTRPYRSGTLHRRVRAGTASTAPANARLCCRRRRCRLTPSFRRAAVAGGSEERRSHDAKLTLSGTAAACSASASSPVEPATVDLGRPRPLRPAASRLRARKTPLGLAPKGCGTSAARLRKGLGRDWRVGRGQDLPPAVA